MMLRTRRSNWLRAFQILFWVGATLVRGVPAIAGCQPSGTKLSDSDKEDFLADPSATVALYASQTELLAFQIGGLARVGRPYLDALKTALSTATGPQQRAIGKGIFLAVATCRQLDNDAAAEIESWAKMLTNPNFIEGYRRAEYIAEVNSTPPALPPPVLAAPQQPNTALSLGTALPKSGPVQAPALDLPDPFKIPEP